MIRSLANFMVKTGVALEKRFHPSSEPPAWYSSFFGGTSNSGVSVTDDSALTLTAVFSAVRILSETLASLPLIVYKRLPKGGKERDYKHPLYRLLHTQPNPEMSAFSFFETCMAWLCLRGNAYAEIERDGSGNPIALWPIPANRVQVERGASGRLQWRVSLPNGGQALLLPGEILHVPGLSLNGITGLSPIGYARESIGLGLAAQEFGARLFSDKCIPGGILEHPGRLKDAATVDRLRQQVDEQHKGLSRSHRTLLLEEGMKWHQTAIAPEDAQFLETRKFQVTEIARFYRIPPHMMGDLDRATFCLPADVEVMTEGGPKPISIIKAGEKVWSLGAGGLVLAPVRRSSCTGDDKIIEFRTTNRTIRCNAKHRILVRRKKCSMKNISWVNEYVPAGDLKVGDTLVTLDKLPKDGRDVAPNGRKISVGFMEFCGHMLGNGHVYPEWGVLIARAKDARYMNAYREIAKREFVSYVGGNGRGDKTRVATAPVRFIESERSTKFASVLAATELTALGFAGTARVKRVPEWVFGLSFDLRLAFVRGFLDADGHVDKNGRARFDSVNQAMLSQFRHLCMGLGIPVTNMRRSKQIVRLPNGQPFDAESFSFTCSDPAANAMIGSHDPRDVIRISQGKPFNRKDRNYPRFGGVGFSTQGCSLSRISSIRHCPSEPVYDLEVDGTHSFIANGVVVHNSNIEQQSIDFVVNTMRSWIVRWEQAIQRTLFFSDEQSTYFTEFLVDGLLRGDIQSRYQSYSIGITNGFLSPDQVREMENMNPRPDGKGGEFLRPLNMEPASAAPKSPASREAVS